MSLKENIATLKLNTFLTCRVCAYVKQYEDRPIVPIRDSLKSISTQIGRAIVEFHGIYEKLMDKNRLQEFRRKAYFNLLETPQKLVLPSMDMVRRA